MAALPPIDPANPRWQGRIDQTKKKAYDQGYRHGVQNSHMCSWKLPEYIDEYNRGYRNARERARVCVD
jgi:ribosome modulation factor